MTDIKEITKNIVFHPVRKKMVAYVYDDSTTPVANSYTVVKPDQDGMMVHTITEDGHETENIARVGDIIRCGSSRELHVIRGHKFKSLYDGTLYGTVTPEQTPRNVAQYHGAPTTFIASWGEEIVLKTGDFLVMEEIGQFYRIAQKEFLETYDLKI